MELLIEKVFALVFLLIGLSHLFQPVAWDQFFVWLRTKVFGAFIVVMYTLPVGIIILIFHNDWTLKPGLFITIAGWISVVKCAIYAVYPQSFNRVAKKGFSKSKSVAAGALLIGLSLAVLIDVFVLNTAK